MGAGKLTPIPYQLYKTAFIKLIPMGVLSNSSEKLIPGIVKGMLCRTISVQTL